MTPAPKRHWFRFSLRTLFVVVTVFAVPLGWVAYQLNWIRQRREFIRAQAERGNAMGTMTAFIDAPGMLWVFRENGYRFIGVLADEDATASDTKRATALFPEAQILAMKRPSAFNGTQL